MNQEQITSALQRLIAEGLLRTSYKVEPNALLTYGLQLASLAMLEQAPVEFQNFKVPATEATFLRQLRSQLVQADEFSMLREGLLAIKFQQMSTKVVASRKHSQTSSAVARSSGFVLFDAGDAELLSAVKVLLAKRCWPTTCQLRIAYSNLSMLQVQELETFFKQNAIEAVAISHIYYISL